MASNSTINVKVPVKVLVKHLKERLAQIKKDKANEAKMRAEYAKAVKDWEAGLKFLVPKAQKPEDVEIRHHAYGVPDDKVKIDVTYIIPKSKVIERPDAPNFMADYEYNSATESMEGAIRLLEMTEDEFVSTSSYKSIAKYL
jgi:hypothetical protein